jgi:hypothetical protein
MMVFKIETNHKLTKVNVGECVRSSGFFGLSVCFCLVVIVVVV